MTDPKTPASNGPQPDFGIDDISKAIVNDKPSVSESTFVFKILPSILGLNETDVDIGVWAEFAGSPMTPLIVTGHQGEVLFEAPSPLRDVTQIVKRNIDDPESDPQSLSSIATIAELKTNVHPRLGEQFLNHSLSEIDLIRDVDDNDYRKRWQAILARYNLAPGEAVKPESESKAQASNVTFSDEDEEL